MTNGDERERSPGPPILRGEGSLVGPWSSRKLPASPTPGSPQQGAGGGALRARAALSSPDAAERAAAVAWLGEHAPRSFIPDDLALLHDPDLAVRAAAAVALRAAPDPVLVNGARLALRMLVEGNPAERHAGLRAAAAIANPTLAPRLLPFLAHDEPETRRLTLLALAAVPPGLLPPTFLRDPLLTLLTDPDPGVRATAAALLPGGGSAQG